jgi:hypothetical protein
MTKLVQHFSKKVDERIKVPNWKTTSKRFSHKGPDNPEGN